MSLGLYAQLACIWEATARKAGNVHRFRDFDDLTYVDFLLSAAAIAPVIEQATTQRVGVTVLEGVRATRQVVNSNTNLGILLLLAPLAAVPLNAPLRPFLEEVLANLDVLDSRAVYEAIRLAQPGGLGRASEQDVSDEPTLPLGEIMALAADRDLIAYQYTHGFAQVFNDGLPAFFDGLQWNLEIAIQHCQLQLLAKYPDSLIQRKRGLAEALEASQRAQRVLEIGWPNAPAGQEAFQELDDWLRAEGNSRNPGTTADLVTACLFVVLRERIMNLPLPFVQEPRS